MIPEFNLSMGQNITSIPNMMANVNSSVMGGLYGTFILASLFITFYLIFLKATGNFNRALLGSAFATLFLSLLFRAMTLINDVTMFITIIILAIAIVSTKNRE